MLFSAVSPALGLSPSLGVNDVHQEVGLRISQGGTIGRRQPVSLVGRTPDVPRDSCRTEAALGESDAIVIVSHPLETLKELSSLFLPLSPCRPGR